MASADNNPPNLPDMSLLSEEEQQQVTKVMQKAQEFEMSEEKQLMRQPLEGLLYKYTNAMKGWQHRWFVLEPDSGKLKYFLKEVQKGVARARGALHLAGAVICPSVDDSETFIVNAANGEVYRLRALDARERQHWVNRLRATAEYHTGNLTQHAPSAEKENKPVSGSHVNQHSPSSQGSTFYAEESTSSTEHIEQNTPNVDSSRKSILQVNTRLANDPFKKIRDKLSHIHDQSDALCRCIEDLPSGGEHITATDRDLLMMKATSNATIAALENCLSILQQQLPADHSPSIPEAMLIEWLDPKPQAESHVSASSVVLHSTSLPLADVVDHSLDVEDKEEYSDTDLGAVDEHKSVILNLLSQLKLGMDLTKVVLPTFILEKRSLLEMFADCMAHPDYFVSIPDLPTPEARMIGVLKWYLTSFHAGRKSCTGRRNSSSFGPVMGETFQVVNGVEVDRSDVSMNGSAIAKKPYNPIIGETFHCSWHVPQNKTASTSLSDSLASESKSACNETVPLYYCAEQVSHHPPISAFYFECPDKQISMNASIYTKSKFMGMSVGVSMVGKVCLKDMCHDEEYVFSLPSVYARSILTVPWVEMGDRVTLTCKTSGYNAAIVFHTKPFYGGTLHRISAEVKNPSSEIICRVSGEWNGEMQFSYSNGENEMIDTSKMSSIRKRVRPLSKQADSESRKLWKNVTHNLKVGDINKATEYKRHLEEQQRQGERKRKESNTFFPTKYFHNAGNDAWVYNTPLKKNNNSL